MAAGHPDPVVSTPSDTLDCDPAKLTLRLVYVLEQALGTTMGESAVQWALRRRTPLIFIGMVYLTKNREPVG